MKFKVPIILLSVAILAGLIFGAVTWLNMPEAEIVKPGSGVGQESYISAEGVPQDTSGKSNEVEEPETIEGENLALHKPVSADSYTQVYYDMNAVDGNVDTYWEGASNAYPNTLIVDLEEVVSIKAVRIKLNPRPVWTTRVQTFSISGSLDGEEYTTIVDSTDYTFDPMRSNTVTIYFDPVNVRYVKLEFTANSGAPGGQIGELEIY
ncbi:MAG: discoidin domain-containing protein [Actinomycetota bacterium]|nr:discoidin domain-containing protein [Actinomycetota bacterium]